MLTKPVAAFAAPADKIARAMLTCSVKRARIAAATSGRFRQRRNVRDVTCSTLAMLSRLSPLAAMSMKRSSFTDRPPSASIAAPVGASLCPPASETTARVGGASAVIPQVSPAAPMCLPALAHTPSRRPAAPSPPFAAPKRNLVSRASGRGNLRGLGTGTCPARGGYLSA
jgi:hypothetical protein